MYVIFVYARQDVNARKKFIVALQEGHLSDYGMSDRGAARSRSRSRSHNPSASSNAKKLAAVARLKHGDKASFGSSVAGRGAAVLEDHEVVFDCIGVQRALRFTDRVPTLDIVRPGQERNFYRSLDFVRAICPVNKLSLTTRARASMEGMK